MFWAFVGGVCCNMCLSVWGLLLVFVCCLGCFLGVCVLFVVWILLLAFVCCFGWWVLGFGLGGFGVGMVGLFGLWVVMLMFGFLVWVFICI